ncbi:major capsid protein [Clostridium botulinum]|uniref:major capsid protein n=1 Tax=Clostridium botulinum TaxID=1491 RepID=UPI0004D8B6EB|nr:major capsid protein [Clostridium botulinum]KEH90481.1 phage capsid protein [Clostridium botulinum C/D str. It1]
MELRDFITAKQIALYIKNLPPEVTLDKALFPNVKQMGMEIEMAKGAKQRPVALKLSTFDVAVKPRTLKADINLEKKDMPFFKESVFIKEKDRQNLLLAMNGNNQNLVNQLLSQIFKNYKALVDGAEVQARRMRAQLLQNGEIKIITKDGDIVADYSIPKNHKETLQGTAKWSDPTANIVEDIERWQNAITNEGYTKPTRMLLTKKTFGYVQANKAIQAEIKGINNVIITEKLVKDYLKNKLDIEVGFLSGVFVDETGKPTNLYEDNKVSLIPKGPLGETKYGTTPEEADMLYGSKKLNTEIVNTGVAITTMTKEDPVTVETKVSQLVMPSFDRADECFFATVV